MDIIMELLRIVLPALLLALAVWYVMKKALDRMESGFTRKDNGTEAEKVKILLPLKLKAYERLIIFLERISPGSLVFRLNDGAKSSAQMQLELLKAVREEYEHNLSLQIYVSEAAWEEVKLAKDEVLQLIKTAGKHVGSGGSAMELNRAIFELEADLKESRLRRALRILNLEIRIAMGED